jgi:hypothetical protein
MSGRAQTGAEGTSSGETGTIAALCIFGRARELPPSGGTLNAPDRFLDLFGAAMTELGQPRTDDCNGFWMGWQNEGLIYSGFRDFARTYDRG